MNDVIKVEKAKVDKAAEEFERKNLALEKELKEVRAERDQQSHESTKARVAFAEKQCLVADLKEQLLSIASAAICKAKTELYKDYLSGEHTKWNSVDIKEMINTYEEMRRLEESSLEEGEEQSIG